MMKILFGEIENYFDEIMTLKQNGYQIDGVELSWLWLTRNREKLDSLTDMDIIIDFSIERYNGAERREKLERDFPDFVEFCKSNIGKFSYVSLKNGASLNLTMEFGRKLINEDIPVIIDIPYPDTEENIPVLKKEGFTNISLRCNRALYKGTRYKEFIENLKKDGVKLFVLNYKYSKIGIMDIEAVSLLSWRNSTKRGRVYTNVPHGWKETPIKDNPIVMASIFKDDLWNVFPQGREAYSHNNYQFLDIWNLIFLNNIYHKRPPDTPAVLAAKTLMESGQDLPSWVTDLDNSGKRKLHYIKTRFNSLTDGSKASVLSEMALQCNNCIVKDTCPLFQPDSICAFLPHWKRLGIVKRDENSVLSHLENLISEKKVRYERAKFFEAASGGGIDMNVSALENDLIKALETYHKILFGSNRGSFTNTGMTIIQTGDTKNIISGNIEEELSKIRSEYGEAMAKKIEKRLTSTE